MDDYVDRVFKGAATEDFRTPASIGQARRWFRRDVQEFYTSLEGNMPARPAIPAIGANATSTELINTTLGPKDVKGMVIGELHHEPGAYKFAIKDMAVFKANGVTTIYLENAPYLEGSPVFGAGAYQPQDAVYAYPRPYDYSIYTPNSPIPLDLITQANKHGIKVIGLEHPYLTAHTDNHSLRTRNRAYVTERLSELNYYAAKIIEKTPQGEKWVALVGNAHMNTTGGVPGIAELTGGIGVSIVEAVPGARSLAITPTAIPEDQRRFYDVTGDIQFNQNVDEFRLP